MKFGEAITLLNAGHPIAREGWNGKGMFLIRAGGYKVDADKVKPNGIITTEFLERRGLTHLEILPHIDMWTAQDTYLAGWLASQSDMLADDWMIYKEEAPAFSLNPQQVQAMKDAGVWDDPATRMVYIQRYRNAQLQNLVGKEFDKHYYAWKKVDPEVKPKKPHWTQTAKGKKILARRRKKK